LIGPESFIMVMDVEVTDAHPDGPLKPVSSGLNAETVLAAARALLVQVHRSDSSPPGGNNIDGADSDVDSEIISVVLTLKCPPKRTCLKPRTIPLTHPLYREDVHDVCFIVKDPQRLVKDHLAEHNVKGISKVLGVSKVEKRYGTHEGRRELSKLYDLFLVDDRVMPMMPRLLGNNFIRSKKLPLIIRMDRDIPKSIRNALCSTSFTPGSGTTCTIRVARACFTPEQIAENVHIAIEKVASTFNNNLLAFQAIYIKAEKSPSLPIFVSLPTGSDFSKSPEEKAAISGALRKKVTKFTKLLTRKSAKLAKKRVLKELHAKKLQSRTSGDVGEKSARAAKRKRQESSTAPKEDGAGIELVNTNIVDERPDGKRVKHSSDKLATKSDAGKEQKEVESATNGVVLGEQVTANDVGIVEPDGKVLGNQAGLAVGKRKTSNRPLVRAHIAKKARHSRAESVDSGRKSLRKKSIRS
jgi:ribosome biogenesis protein UTP30